ncbi:hypothetical protein X975_18557, partial [Stegodyphus mimosarum]
MLATTFITNRRANNDATCTKQENTKNKFHDVHTCEILPFLGIDTDICRQGQFPLSNNASVACRLLVVIFLRLSPKVLLLKFLNWKISFSLYAASRRISL